MEGERSREIISIVFLWDYTEKCLLDGDLQGDGKEVKEVF